MTAPNDAPDPTDSEPFAWSDFDPDPDWGSALSEGRFDAAFDAIRERFDKWCTDNDFDKSISLDERSEQLNVDIRLQHGEVKLPEFRLTTSEPFSVFNVASGSAEVGFSLGARVTEFTARPWLDLAKIAYSHGLVVTDGLATTGHNTNSPHYRGEAIDVRTRGVNQDRLNAFVRDMRRIERVGIRDERVQPAGQKVWSAPHMHFSGGTRTQSASPQAPRIPDAPLRNNPSGIRSPEPLLAQPWLFLP